MSTTRYIKDGTKILRWTMDNSTPTYEKLPEGFYKLGAAGPGGILTSYEPIKAKDELIRFKSGTVAAVLKEIGTFFSEETTKKYKELKVTQKMGLIMYGPHGTGKSCTAHLIMLELIDKYKALCLDITNTNLSFVKRAIGEIREFQDNPIVLMCDEIDYSIYNEEEKWLTLLDGIDSVANCIVVGCTNYLDKIPDRIKKRPSRIKRLFEIKSLPDSVYKEYLTEKLPNIEKQTLDRLVYEAVENKLTIDQLKHAVIDWYIDGIEISKVMKRAKRYDDDSDTDEGED